MPREVNPPRAYDSPRPVALKDASRSVNTASSSSAAAISSAPAAVAPSKKPSAALKKSVRKSTGTKKATRPPAPLNQSSLLAASTFNLPIDHDADDLLLDTVPILAPPRYAARISLAPLNFGSSEADSPARAYPSPLTPPSSQDHHEIRAPAARKARDSGFVGSDEAGEEDAYQAMLSARAPARSAAQPSPPLVNSSARRAFSHAPQSPLKTSLIRPRKRAPSMLNSPHKGADANSPNPKARKQAKASRAPSKSLNDHRFTFSTPGAGPSRKPTAPRTDRPVKKSTLSQSVKAAAAQRRKSAPVSLPKGVPIVRTAMDPNMPPPPQSPSDDPILLKGAERVRFLAPSPGAEAARAVQDRLDAEQEDELGFSVADRPADAALPKLASLDQSSDGAVQEEEEDYWGGGMDAMDGTGFEVGGVASDSDDDGGDADNTFYPQSKSTQHQELRLSDLDSIRALVPTAAPSVARSRDTTPLDPPPKLASPARHKSKSPTSCLQHSPSPSPRPRSQSVTPVPASSSPAPRLRSPTATPPSRQRATSHRSPSGTPVASQVDARSPSGTPPSQLAAQPVPSVTPTVQQAAIPSLANTPDPVQLSVPASPSTTPLSLPTLRQLITPGPASLAAQPSADRSPSSTPVAQLTVDPAVSETPAPQRSSSRSPSSATPSSQPLGVVDTPAPFLSPYVFGPPRTPESYSGSEPDEESQARHSLVPDPTADEDDAAETEAPRSGDSVFSEIDRNWAARDQSLDDATGWGARVRSSLSPDSTDDEEQDAPEQTAEHESGQGARARQDERNSEEEELNDDGSAASDSDRTRGATDRGEGDDASGDDDDDDDSFFGEIEQKSLLEEMEEDQDASDVLDVTAGAFDFQSDQLAEFREFVNAVDEPEPQSSHKIADEPTFVEQPESAEVTEAGVPDLSPASAAVMQEETLGDQPLASVAETLEESDEPVNEAGPPPIEVVPEFAAVDPVVAADPAVAVEHIVPPQAQEHVFWASPTPSLNERTPLERIRSLSPAIEAAEISSASLAHREDPLEHHLDQTAVISVELNDVLGASVPSPLARDDFPSPSPTRRTPSASLSPVRLQASSAFPRRNSSVAPADVQDRSAADLSAPSGDHSAGANEPWIKVSSNDPRQAARATAFLKLFHDYIETGFDPNASTASSSRDRSRMSSFDSSRRRSSAAYLGDLSMISVADDLLMEAEQEIALDEGKASPNTDMLDDDDVDDLPIPGSFTRATSTQSLSSFMKERAAPVARRIVDRPWGPAEWRSLMEALDSAGPAATTDAVIARFMQRMRVEEADLEGEWTRSKLSLRVASIQQRRLNERARPTKRRRSYHPQKELLLPHKAASPAFSRKQASVSGQSSRRVPTASQSSRHQPSRPSSSSSHKSIADKVLGFFNVWKREPAVALRPRQSIPEFQMSSPARPVTVTAAAAAILQSRSRSPPPTPQVIPPSSPSVGTSSRRQTIELTPPRPSSAALGIVPLRQLSFGGSPSHSLASSGMPSPPRPAAARRQTISSAAVVAPIAIPTRAPRKSINDLPVRPRSSFEKTPPSVSELVRSFESARSFENLHRS